MNAHLVEFGKSWNIAAGVVILRPFLFLTIAGKHPFEIFVIEIRHSIFKPLGGGFLSPPNLQVPVHCIAQVSMPAVPTI